MSYVQNLLICCNEVPKVFCISEDILCSKSLLMFVSHRIREVVSRLKDVLFWRFPD